MAEVRRLPQDYPPAQHVLRELRLWSEAGAERPVAGITVTPELFGADGACATGALAVLVDAVAGGAALRAETARAAQCAAVPRAAQGAAVPGWIATSDMRLHRLAHAGAGELVARTELLRSGRTSVVLDVEVDAGETRVAHATVAFARLEAQGEYQRRPREERLGRVEFGAGSAGFTKPWAESLGVHVVDAPCGVVELPIVPYVGNSLGGLQGGIAVALLDLAAAAAGGAALGRPALTRDLAVHFLAIGRTGPMRTRASVLRGGPAELLVRVESRDAGADGRLCTVATATVVPA